MPPRKKPSSSDLGTLVKRYTLHHTDDGHYKYYYISVYQKNGKVILEKKWGRIGSANGSVSTKDIGARNLTLALSSADRQLEDLKKSKLDKGYKIVKDIDKVPAPSEEPKNQISSRFRDIF